VSEELAVAQSTQPAGSHVYLARQPIFDRALNVYGYELLYRSSANGGFDGTDAALATMQVLNRMLLGFGLDQLLEGKLGFVNFPRELLVADLAHMLPAESVVIEILESVEPDDQVVAACRRLKESGYLLALDDVAPATPSLELAGFAGILKVDYRATTAAERNLLVHRYRNPGTRLLAEKVETQQDVSQAQQAGFDLFQGYFFTRPVILARKEVPAFKLNYLRLLAVIQAPELEFGEIECLIKQEASLCQRLLRYVNSAAFARRFPVTSIRDGLCLLGEDELRRWVSLAALPALASDRPAELVKSAVWRARFCELVAPSAGLAWRSAEIFLMGMFSLLDAMLGRPLEEILMELRLTDDLRDALLGKLPKQDKLACIFELALACEQADWKTVSAVAQQLELPPEAVTGSYLEAVSWSGQIFQNRP
jgi:EAL and modified HD-GYP domain-containing signal transduction protein